MLEAPLPPGRAGKAGLMSNQGEGLLKFHGSMVQKMASCCNIIVESKYNCGLHCFH